MNNSGKTTAVNDTELYDVFLGRGDGVAKKHGNVLYRKLIKENKKRYKSARGNTAKDNVTRNIINIFKRKGGIFYIKQKNDKKDEKWVLSTEHATITKVKQALREPEPETKKNNLIEKETALVKMDERIVDKLMSSLEDSNLYDTHQYGHKCCYYSSMDSPYAVKTAHSNRSSLLTMSSSISSRVSLLPPTEDDIQNKSKMEVVRQKESSINANSTNVANIDVIEPIQISDPLFHQSLHIDGIYDDHCDQQQTINTSCTADSLAKHQSLSSSKDQKKLEFMLNQPQFLLPSPMLRNDEICTLPSLDNVYSSLTNDTYQRARAYSS